MGAWYMANHWSQLATGQELNEKNVSYPSIHNTLFILHGALVGVGSPGPTFCAEEKGSCWLAAPARTAHDQIMSSEAALSDSLSTASQWTQLTLGYKKPKRQLLIK